MPKVNISPTVYIYFCKKCVRSGRIGIFGLDQKACGNSANGLTRVVAAPSDFPFLSITAMILGLRIAQVFKAAEGGQSRRAWRAQLVFLGSPAWQVL